MDESDCEPQRKRGSASLIGTLTLAVTAAASASAQSGLHPTDVNPGRIWSDIIIVLILVLVNGLFAMSEAAFLSVRRTRIEQLVEEGSRSAKLVAGMLAEPTRTLATIQVGITFIALFTGGAAADSAVGPLAAWLRGLWQASVPPPYLEVIAFVAVMVVVTLVTLVLGEITPKSLAVQRAELIILIAAYPLRLVQFLTSPVVTIVARVSDMLVRPFGGRASFHPTAMSQEELKLMVEQSEEYGVIEPQEKEMIHSIFEFSDTPVRRVMTPRLDITAVSCDTSVLGVLGIVKESGHSRLPVYDGDLDHIVGILHVKDAIDHLVDPTETGAGACLHDRGGMQARELMRPAYFVPESKRVDDLLADLRRNKSHIAVVRDEYGTVVGVVTIEDLLEEIVGEIQDEYDLEDPEITQVDSVTMIVDARMTVADFNERMGTELPVEDADTLGGFVFGLLGHQPEEHEEVRWGDFAFQVETTDGRRVQKVRVVRLPEPAMPQQDVGPSKANGGHEITA